MAYKPRQPATRRPRKVAPKRRAALARPSRSFVKKVQSVIHKNAETKQTSYTFSVTQFNGGVNSTGDVCRVIPILEQGTGEGNRIGDTVAAQSLDVRGHFFINITPNVIGSSGNPTSIPFGARLMIRAFICSVKKYSNYDDAQTHVSSWSSSFLKNGNTSQGLDGSIQSMYLPVNTDVITVHKEMKKYITIPAINTNISTSIGFSNTANDYVNTVKFFNANIKCKKVLKYDDSNFSPQNFAPFMVVSFAHLDGTSAAITSTNISAMYVSTLKYEDV